MLGLAQKLIPLPPGAHGLALEDNKLYVLGVDQATVRAYLDKVKAAWTDIVRADVERALYTNATASFRRIREELAEAQEAEALGVPPPGGRSSAELNDLIAQGQAAFKAVYQAVQAATSVADINAVLETARQQGLDWLVGPDWQPYPETCPWTVAT